MNSIRKKLLLYILSILALGTMAVCVATYFGMRHEMDELYDANMRQLALTASGMIGRNGESASALPYSKAWPHGEEVFLIQIWKNGKLQYTSHPIADFPLQQQKGGGRVYFHDKKWSYYQDEIGGYIVQVSQDLSVRRTVIRDLYKAIVIPILIQFPILALLVWFFVGYGFRPLSRLSDLIQKRTADFMEPIPPNDTPREIMVLVVALNDLLQRLKTSLETQRRFTADAAHELRTPLTAVRLQLDLLQRADRPEDRKDAIETLERGVSRSIRLVQQLLELARQEPENTMQKLSAVRLSDLAQNMAEENHPLARQKSIGLKTDLQNVTVRGDAVGLSVLIGNLLSNAIAYTPDGGHVLLKTFMDDGRPALEILDDGIGIAPHDRTRVFDRFYRVVGTGVIGSGLGLSIVRNIADRHGADIHISGGIGGKGTGFRLVFPAP